MVNRRADGVEIFRLRGYTKYIFHCGGFAAAMKNIFFLFFFGPAGGGFWRSSRPRSEKGQTSGEGPGEG